MIMLRTWVGGGGNESLHIPGRKGLVGAWWVLMASDSRNMVEHLVGLAEPGIGCIHRCDHPISALG